MKRPVAIFGLLLSIVASAAEKEWSLPIGSDVYTLTPFGPVYVSHHYFGEYAYPTQATGGTKLHLFPNGRFVLSEWSDVGPDLLRAAGSYEIQEDRLALHFTRVQAGHETLRKKFAGLHLVKGAAKGKDFTGFSLLIFTEKDWDLLQTKPQKAQFMSRGTEYNDWERVLREYEAEAKKR